MEKLNPGKFDFVEAVVEAYKFVWAKKSVLMQLGLVPFLIKSLLFLMIVIFSIQDNYWRSGLILLPSYVAEAWLIAQGVRLLMLLHARHFADAPFLMLATPDAAAHKRNLLASVILYTLIKLITAFLFGLIVSLRNLEIDPAAPPPEFEIPPFAAALVGLAFVFITVWVFRYVWIYVPVAMGYKIGTYVTAAREFITSFYMLALWMMCFVPVVLGLLLVSEVLLQIFPPLDPQTPMPIFTYIMVFIQSAAELLIALVSSVAMAFGVHALIRSSREKT